MRSVTLNLANKFSQCTFSVAEHYDLFSGLIILRQAWWRRLWRHTAPTAPNRQRNCCRKSSTLPHRPEINLYASYHEICDENDNSESTFTSNPSGTTDDVFTKLPRPLALKTAKHFSQLATYLASFSVTYLATSLKLSKLSVKLLSASVKHCSEAFIVT